MFIYTTLISVAQNILISTQVNSRFRNDRHRTNRRYYNFDYDFNDWENATQIELDYTLDLNTEGQNDSNWNPIVNFTTEYTENTTPAENTTPVIFVTIPYDPNSEVNTPVKDVTTGNTNETDVTYNPLNPLANEVTINTNANDQEMTFPFPYETKGPSTPQTYTQTNGNDSTAIENLESWAYEQAKASMMAKLTTESTPGGPMIHEAHVNMVDIGAGYFTTFVVEAFKIMASKNKTDMSKLLAALETEVVELNSADKFHGFGNSTIAAFVVIVKMIKYVPPDIAQRQLAIGHDLLMNRTVNLPGEIVIAMDLADGVYLQEEGERMLALLEDINDFPNTTKSDREIAREVIDAVILKPYMRIYGSPEEKFLVKRLEQVIVKYFFRGVPVERSRNDSMSQNVLISHQIFLNNKFIGNDILHKNGRRYYNFDNDFNDEDGNQFDYNHDWNESDGPSRKQGKPWNPIDNVTSTISTKTDTTPMIFVTIPTSVTIPTTLATIPISISTIPTTVSVLTPGVVLKPSPGSENFNLSETTTLPSKDSIPKELLTIPNIETVTSPVQTIPTTLTLSTVSISTDHNETSTNIPETQNITITSPTNVTGSLIPMPITPSPSDVGAGQAMEQSETTTSQYDEMTFPYTATSLAAATDNQTSQIAKQALQDMQDLQAGYFTVFLLELARVFSKKQHQDAARLLQAFESEVMALLSAKKLSGFGKSTIAAFVRFVRMMNNVPAEAVQYEANVGVYIIMNRRVTLGREIVNVLDETDRIFLEKEGRRILKVLEDIDNYPNINKTAQEVVHEMMDAVVVAPFVRVYGTAEEVTIVQQIEDLVVRMVFSGYAIQRRRGDVRSTSRRKYRTSQRYRNTKQVTRIIPKHTRRIYSTWKKLRTTYYITTRRTFTKNHKKIHTIKNKIKRHRIRLSRPKKIDNKHIGKYNVIYLKLPDLDMSKENNRLNIKTDNNKSTTRPKFHMKQSTKFYKPKDEVLLKRFKLIKRKNKEKDLKKHRFIAPKIMEESSFTDDEEEKLKANLDDAFFHGNDEPEFRNRERLNKQAKYSPGSSFSNEEALLKSNIYKVFGYKNDFANAIKRREKKQILI